VTLTDDEMAAARKHAIDVVTANLRQQYQNKFDPRSAGFKDEVEAKTMGYAGEIAAAHVTGLSGPHWEVFGAGYRTKDKNRDIGSRTDVKTTGPAAGYLWVRKGDKAGYLYLLVTGRGPEFTVHGWLEGVEAMVPRWWVEEKPNPAWKIPQWRLNALPMPGNA
jgi:hypothetical protein